MSCKKLKTIDIELALCSFLDYRVNLIVPNVSWGMFSHECDLLVLTKSGYASEVEIKVDKYDLIKDKLKRHKHKDYRNRIKYLYFAIPFYLEDCIDHIPGHAGVIIVGEDLRCKIIRKPKRIGKYKFSMEERYQIARLGALRIWNLKRKIKSLKSKRK